MKDINVNFIAAILVTFFQKFLEANVNRHISQNLFEFNEGTGNYKACRLIWQQLQDESCIQDYQ
jgi:hypothetical protein